MMNSRREKEYNSALYDYIPEIQGKIVNIITWIVLVFIFILIWGLLLVERPESIEAQCVVYADNQPQRLIPMVSGQIVFLHSIGDSVHANEDIAYIRKAAVYQQIIQLDKCISNLNDVISNQSFLQHRFDSIGEISDAYINLIKSIIHYNDIIDSRFYSTNIHRNNIEIESLKSNISSQNSNLNYQKNLLIHYSDEFKLDSCLFHSSNAITLDIYNQHKLRLLQQQESVAKAYADITRSLFQIQTLENEIQQIKIQEENDIKNSFNDIQYNHQYLQDAIKLWKERYVLHSELNGIIENVHHIENNQFVPEGVEVSRIIPHEKSLRSQISFSNVNASKVKDGTRVKIYLYDYRRDANGFIVGKITNISKSLVIGADSQMTYTADLEIDFDNQPYFKGDFKMTHGMQGEAHILIRKHALIVSIMNWVKELTNTEI